MVDNDLLVVLAQGKNPVVAHFFINHLLDAKVAETELRATSATSRRRFRSPRTRWWPTGSSRRTSRPRSCSTKDFDVGVPLLELPAAADAAWHQVWQEFKAGG